MIKVSSNVCGRGHVSPNMALELVSGVCSGNKSFKLLY